MSYREFSSQIQWSLFHVPENIPVKHVQCGNLWLKYATAIIKYFFYEEMYLVNSDIQVLLFTRNYMRLDQVLLSRMLPETLHCLHLIFFQLFIPTIHKRDLSDQVKLFCWFVFGAKPTHSFVFGGKPPYSFVFGAKPSHSFLFGTKPSHLFLA